MNLRQPSRHVASSQADIHPRLEAILARHLARPWRQPPHGPSVRAFEALEGLLAGKRASLVLDSGCGTAQSTRKLAERFPESCVIGVDKSLARLGRGGVSRFPHREGNAILVRAELETFWRLCAERGWRLQRHYLLYPNPWPKASQLRRRWHAHPVFPDMLRLGGRLELRCNWEIYAREFAFSVNRICGTALEVQRLDPSEPLSPFERKYRASGHALYSVVLPSESNRVK
jgi:tRNA (guanine-N7-)-methyltransferase